MDYIIGTLTILSELEQFNAYTAYYSPRGIDMNGEEIVNNLDVALKKVSKFNLTLKLKDYVELTFNTRLAARGLYETFMFPASCGELAHIYCVGPLETIDLKDNWDKYRTTIDNKVYYVYTQKNKVKDNQLTYRFVFNK